MKKVVFVSENHRLIERMTATLSSRSDIDCLLFSTSRILLAMDDVKEFGAELVILDFFTDHQNEEMQEVYKQIQEDDEKRECVWLVHSEQMSGNDWKLNSNDVTKLVACDESLEPLFSFLKHK